MLQPFAFSRIPATVQRPSLHGYGDVIKPTSDAVPSLEKNPQTLLYSLHNMSGVPYSKSSEIDRVGYAGRAGTGVVLRSGVLIARNTRLAVTVLPDPVQPFR